MWTYSYLCSRWVSEWRRIRKILKVEKKFVLSKFIFSLPNLYEKLIFIKNIELWNCSKLLTTNRKNKKSAFQKVPSFEVSIFKNAKFRQSGIFSSAINFADEANRIPDAQSVHKFMNIFKADILQTVKTFLIKPKIFNDLSYKNIVKKSISFEMLKICRKCNKRKFIYFHQPSLSNSEGKSTIFCSKFKQTKFLRKSYFLIDMQFQFYNQAKYFAQIIF